MEHVGRPISPSEALERRKIPPQVYDVINQMLSLRYQDGEPLMISRNGLFERLYTALSTVSRGDLEDAGWVNAILEYEHYGWDVKEGERTEDGIKFKYWTLTRKA